MSDSLRPSDDALHPPANDDPFWTETHWFAFGIPERRLSGCVYPVFRPNLGICSAGVFLWDDSGEADHDIVYFHNFWHLPLPDDLRVMDLPGGLSFRCDEPLVAWRVRYDDGAELQLDLAFEGLHEPFTGLAKSASPGTGHFDQACRVTGSIRLNGDELTVDGYEMRDKSWGPRSDLRVAPRPADPALQAGGSYSYGVSGDTAFVVGASGGLDVSSVHGGYLLRDGRLAPLVAGERRVERALGRPPTRVVIDAVDELGRHLNAAGTCVNRWAFNATPAKLAWLSGTAWDVDGRAAWGEVQEMYGRPRRRLAGAEPA